jgi:hypothetical protein
MIPNDPAAKPGDINSDDANALSPPDPGGNDEHWKKLCVQASAERDPARLLELVREINDMLAERFKGMRGPAYRTPKES